MKRHILAISLAALLIATLLAVWVVWRSGMNAPEEAVLPEMPGEIGTFSIYTNGEYGFSVMYPSSATLDESASSEYFLPNTWRVNATGEGSPVLAIIAYDTRSENSYPRHFVAQVRIGVSTDEKELAQCEKAALEQGEVALPDVVLNGTTFKAFAFQDAGMMQYVKGVSYRTLHEGACVALEKVQAGSSYRDDAASPADLADETLQAEYEKLGMIVESFAFARP